MSEIESTMTRLKKQTGVKSYIIKIKSGSEADHSKAEGLSMQERGRHAEKPKLDICRKAENQDMRGENASTFTQAAASLTQMARDLVRDLDPSNDLSFLRIKTASDEIMVAPDGELMVITHQNFSKDIQR